MAPLSAPNGSSAAPPESAGRLLGICERRRTTILDAWLSAVPAEDRSSQPGLDDQLTAVFSGLCEILAGRGWGLMQTVIEGLAARHAHSGLKLEKGIQRTLLELRRAVRPHLQDGAQKDAEELLLELLHECVLRFFETYQGLHVASEAERFHTRVIRSLVTALEVRDPYTKGHSMAVALLARKIAASMQNGVDPSRAYLAGLLHDVGKVGVPDEILAKSTELSEAEWQVMRLHPTFGARILRPIKLYPEVLQAVLAHHENQDGTGYPFGLAGDKVPPMARILRVVDSFDAMTSTRVFRHSKPVDDALVELEAMSPPIYDPQVVGHLRRIVGTEEEVRELSLATLQLDLA